MQSLRGILCQSPKSHDGLIGILAHPEPGISLSHHLRNSAGIRSRVFGTSSKALDHTVVHEGDFDKSILYLS